MPVLPASVFCVVCTATTGRRVDPRVADDATDQVCLLRRRDQRAAGLDDLEDLGDVLLRDQTRRRSPRACSPVSASAARAGDSARSISCLSPRMPLIFEASRPLPVMMTSRAYDAIVR